VIKYTQEMENMKLKMIGTGALSVKDRSSCSLIDDRILIDCGNGILKTLLEQNVDISKIDTLLITHLHGDHFLDIPFLIMQRNFMLAQNELKIFGPEGTENTIAKLVTLAYEDIEDWQKEKDKAKVKFIEFKSLNNEEVANNYFVDSYEVKHGNCKPAYGYIVRCNNKVIGFSGDSSYCENIDKIINSSNLSVLDMSFVNSNNKHMGVQDIEFLAKKYNKQIITTHMNQEARELVIENKIKNIIVPNDGDEFEI